MLALEEAPFGGVIALLKAISDPTRLKLVKLLQMRPMCVCELAVALAVAQPTVSQHLRRLKAVGLVRERRDGQMVCYSLTDPGLGQLRRTLDSVLDTPTSEIPALAAELSRCQSAAPRHHCADGPVVSESGHTE